MYKIYRVTNTNNGKVYIGQTKQDVKQRFREHISKNTSSLYTAIKEHGKESFDLTVIDEAETKQEANKKEEYWTMHYKSNVPEYGYNIAVVKTREGKSNGFYGKHHTKQCIKRNRLNQPARIKIMCCDTNEIFVSLREAEKVTGISRPHIKNICDGKIKNPSKQFKYVTEKTLN